MFKFLRIYVFVVIVLAFIIGLAQCFHFGYGRVISLSNLYMLFLLTVLNARRPVFYYLLMAVCVINIPVLFHEDFFELYRSWPSWLQYNTSIWDLSGQLHRYLRVSVHFLTWPLLSYVLLLVSGFTKGAKVFYKITY